MAHSSEPIALIVLAAGKGTRLESDVPKVLTKTSEGTLLEMALSNCAEASPSRLVIVTGYKRSEVERHASSITARLFPTIKCEFVFQPEQLGTGHAVLCAAESLRDHTGPILIVSGDMPLIRKESIRQLLEQHHRTHSTVSVLTALVEHQASYGRIIRDKGEVSGIREFKDASSSELLNREVNTSVYVVDSAFLWPALKNITTENVQKEFYLTDIVAAAFRDGQRISSSLAGSSDEILGVNTLNDLTLVNIALNKRRIAQCIERGVIIEDPATCYFDSEVTIERGVSIGPNTTIKGPSIVKSGVRIDGTALLENCVIEKDAHIKFSVHAHGAKIGARSSIGPFAHLREDTILSEEVKIGNFVETKKAELKAGAKASHLTYLGDCTVGKESNIGAGTITCNYDGYKKYRTEIGEGVFVGSNTSLVAPVRIGDRASIGASSVITSDVEPDALALTRAPLQNKPGWSKRKKELMRKKTS